MKSKRWELLGGNVVWVSPRTLSVLNKVYEFLVKRREVDALRKVRQSTATVSTIAEGVGCSDPAVKNAVFLLAFKADEQIVCVDAGVIEGRGGLRNKLCHNVKLISGDITKK